MKLSLSSLKDLVEGLENRGQLDDSVRLVSQGVLDIPLHGPHLPHSPILLLLSPPGAMLTQIVHYLSSYYTVFHSVIYNSVG